MGGKTRETIFPETQRKVRTKNVGKKSSQKIAKDRFLYSHEYRVQKMREKSRETIFPETHEKQKNVAKKIVVKNCEKKFFICTRIW